MLRRVIICLFLLAVLIGCLIMLRRVINCLFMLAVLIGCHLLHFSKDRVLRIAFLAGVGEKKNAAAAEEGGEEDQTPFFYGRTYKIALE